MSQTLIRNAWITIIIILLARLLTLGHPALLDTTEGRYGSIAKEMALSGDWVTPRVQLGTKLVPYTGKPPLYFWLAASSIKLFGVNEFAVRFPSYLAGLLTIFMLYIFAKRVWGMEVAACSILALLASSFYFVMGAAVIDTLLASLVTAGAISFFLASTDSDKNSAKRWGLLFFILCGLGFLTKGPVALAITGFPIVALLFLRKSIKPLAALPWLGGIPLFTIITLPWFWISELRNPGFLHYFFVNENLLRFVTHDYKDLFGVGHTTARGTIWFFLIVGTLPWVLFLPTAYFKTQRGAARSTELLFAIALGVSPAVFFTLGRQMTPLYALPGVPGLALVAGYLLNKWKGIGLSLRILPIFSSLFILLSVVLSPWLSAKQSTAPIMNEIALRYSEKTAPVVGIPFGEFGNPFSVWFYTYSNEGARYTPVSISRDNLADAPNDIILDKITEAPSGWEIQAGKGKWKYLTRSSFAPQP